MEPPSSAALGEFVRRTVSFLLAKCERLPVTDQEDMKRLCSLLLRSSTILEQGERRHVASRAMLQQLRALRDKTFRAYYIFDVVRCRSSLPGGGDGRKDDDDGGGEEEEEEEEEVNRHAFAVSSSNTAKRVRFSSNRSEAAAGVLLRCASPRELQQMACSLEATIRDMKEFVVFLMGYPILCRQPYSAHLFVVKCMFGRQMERERIMEFLMQRDERPSNNGNYLGVLPITGPWLIGKSTIVEHVCKEERVHNHFSLILWYCGNELKDETMQGFRDNCVIKHQNDTASEEKLLIVIELLDDVDDERWKRLYTSARSIPRGSKMLITSRSKNSTERFGTTEALRLKCLPTEAHWYFFKMLVFGTEDPEQHPKLTSLAMEIAHNMPGSFLYPHMVAALLLKANFNTKKWSMILSRFRQYLKKNVSTLLGEEYPDDLEAKDQPMYGWNVITKQKPDEYYTFHDIYQKDSAPEEVPGITAVDLLFGCDHPQGRYEVLFWKSPIPPYFSYVCTCDTHQWK